MEDKEIQIVKKSIKADTNKVSDALDKVIVKLEAAEVKLDDAGTPLDLTTDLEEIQAKVDTITEEITQTKATDTKVAEGRAKIEKAVKKAEKSK